MGSFIEINDTLRITKEQGFPESLDLNIHLKNPYKLEQIEGEVFEFISKPKIRIYQIPPVRNFLVEDIGGKWVYWGLCHILEVNHDYIQKITFGKYKIIYLNTPNEMKQVHNLIDRNKETDYFIEH